MSFIRAELAARLVLWREPIAWLGLLAAGIWLIWQGYSTVAPLAFAVGLVCAAAGLGLLRGAVRRVRLRAAEPGEGVVVVDEARIGYLGPIDGGFVDLPTLVSVEILHRPPQAPAWLLCAEDGTRLTIPLGAQGAEALLDALSPLPGIDFDAATAALAAPRPGRTSIWRRAPGLASPRLR